MGKQSGILTKYNTALLLKITMFMFLHLSFILSGCSPAARNLIVPDLNRMSRQHTESDRLPSETGTHLCKLRIIPHMVTSMSAYKCPQISYQLEPILRSTWEKVLYDLWQPAGRDSATAFECRLQVHSSKLIVSRNASIYDLTLFASLYSPEGKQLMGRTVSHKSTGAFDGKNTPDSVISACHETAMQFAKQILDTPSVINLAKNKCGASQTKITSALRHVPSQSWRPASGPGRKKSRKLGRYYAVCIGLSEFTDPEISHLPFAANDAEDVADMLYRRGGIPKDSIRTLINSQATKANIESALEGFLSKAGPDDVIILYWSGHGFPQPDNPKNVYFACYDTRLHRPFTGYRMDKVRRSLEEKNAAHVLVMADTCHAGNIVTRGIKVTAKDISIMPAVDEMKTRQTIPEGMAFLLGADVDRKAVEISSWSHGAFTHILLKGLEGAADGFEGSGAKNGIITFGEIKAFMASDLPTQTERILGKAIRPVTAVASGDQSINDLPLIRPAR